MTAKIFKLLINYLHFINFFLNNYKINYETMIEI